jgi:ubiquitin-activating enzyme E1
LEKFKNSFINLALPFFMFSEPDPIKRTKSKEYDEILMGPVKAVPEGYTIYDKVTIKKGSLTFQELFDHLKTELSINITMVACGAFSLYN